MLADIDELEPLFAAVHESAIGTFETCRQSANMSACGVRPGVSCTRSKRREWPEAETRFPRRSAGDFAVLPGDGDGLQLQVEDRSHAAA